MTKQMIEKCPYCDKDTEHRVKRVEGIDHSKGKGGGYLKYMMYHCMVCNRYYQRKR